MKRTPSNTLDRFLLAMAGALLAPILLVALLPVAFVLVFFSPLLFLAVA